MEKSEMVSAEIPYKYENRIIREAPIRGFFVYPTPMITPYKRAKQRNHNYLA